MSHPALDVTGSHDVGRVHSQFSVPLAPAADVEPADVLGVLLQAAAAVETARAAARAMTLPRAARGRIGINGLLSGG
jgi:hypothetical protein